MKTTFITLITTALLALTWSPRVQACHEAVFGPHASFLYGAPSYVSVQAFQVGQGADEGASDHSVSALSAGFTPFRNVPLSVAVVQPLSLVDGLETHNAHDHVHKELGVEDSILALGWRFSLPSMGRGASGHGNFAALMVGADLPTGNVDHDAGDGPIDTLLSGIVSLEFGSLSTVAYAHHQFNAFDRGGSKLGDESFAGAGLGWTFLPGGGRGTHLSAQLGFGWERTGERVIDSVNVADSGGWALLAQPTVVWGPNHHWRVFATFGAPVAQDFAKNTNESRWRAGLGVVWMLGHGGVGSDAGCGSEGCASPIGCEGGCTSAPTAGGCGSCDDGEAPSAADAGGCGSCDDGEAAEPADCAGCAKPAEPSDCGCSG